MSSEGSYHRGHNRDKQEDYFHERQDPWLFFVSSDNHLTAFNTCRFLKKKFKLPSPNTLVAATERNLGLVCLLQKRPVTALFVGNPLTQSWSRIKPPAAAVTVAGVSMLRAGNIATSYRVFLFLIQKDWWKKTARLFAHIFDSESKSWTLGSEYFIEDSQCVICSWTSDSSKAYFADLSSYIIHVFAYDMEKNAWQSIVHNAMIDKGGVSCLGNSSHIEPTIVICNDKLYLIGRIDCHKFLRIWEMTTTDNLTKMESIAEFYYEASNTNILFASDGKHKIFAACKDLLIWYDVRCDEWFSYPVGTRVDEGQHMFSGHVFMPMKQHTVVVKEASQTECANKSWLCMSGSFPGGSHEPLFAFCPEDLRVLIIELPGMSVKIDHREAWSFAAAEKDLGLVCLTHNKELGIMQRFSPFPSTILVGSPLTSSWEMVPFDISIRSQVEQLKPHDRDYEPQAYEFIGLSMAKKQQHTAECALSGDRKRPRGTQAYYLYCFYRKGAQVHVLRFDSETHSWVECADPCEVDARSYGWHCATTGSNKLTSKIYLCSIEFCRGQESYPGCDWRRNNKLRALAYDTETNVWDQDVFPKEGLMSPSDPDNIRSHTQLRPTIVACKDQLFLVGRGDGHDIEYVRIWAIRGDHTMEEVAWLKALAWRGAIRFATDGECKFFVTIAEDPETSLNASRVMEYDLEKNKWTCYPLDFNNKQVSKYFPGVVLL